MIEYDISFHEEIWDIIHSDYENYFNDTTPFEECGKFKPTFRF